MAAIYNSVFTESKHEPPSLEKMHGWNRKDIYTFRRGVIILKTELFFFKQTNMIIVFLIDFNLQKWDLAERGNKWVSEIALFYGSWNLTFIILTAHSPSEESWLIHISESTRWKGMWTQEEFSVTANW